MITEYRITTFDNPFDPFDEQEDWLRFDLEKGYYSDQKVARLLQMRNVPEDATQKELNEYIEQAIDDLIEVDFLNVFKKVSKEIDDMAY